MPHVTLCYRSFPFRLNIRFWNSWWWKCSKASMWNIAAIYDMNVNQLYVGVQSFFTINYLCSSQREVAKTHINCRLKASVSNLWMSKSPTMQDKSGFFMCDAQMPVFLVSLKCQDWRRFYTSHKYRLKTSLPDKCTLLLYADQRFKINLNQKALWDQAVNLLGRVINGPIDKAFSEVRPWLFVYDGISPLVWPLRLNLAASWSWMKSV